MRRLENCGFSEDEHEDGERRCSSQLKELNVPRLHRDRHHHTGCHRTAIPHHHTLWLPLTIMNPPSPDTEMNEAVAVMVNGDLRCVR